VKATYSVTINGITEAVTAELSNAIDVDKFAKELYDKMTEERNSKGLKDREINPFTKWNQIGG
jgi:hypothetical protein